MLTDNARSLGSLLADILQQIDAGEPIDWDGLFTRHPEHYEELIAFRRGNEAMTELARPSGLASMVNGHTPPTTTGRFAGFELLEEVGRGGMGVVYRAQQIRPNRIVALKMVLAGRHASERALRRFRLEAEAAARLRHASIVTIHEVGEHEGMAYYVMDFIDGESLDERLARGPLAPRTAAAMLLEVTRAIAHAHQQEVIHRDLKPANILIECSPLAPREETSASNETTCAHFNGDSPPTSGPPSLVSPSILDPRSSPFRTYITDFGLARLLDADDNLTATGEVVGTASYMAPEQAGVPGASTGPAADIYGLGAILYAMLTGRPPFQAASREETIAQVKFKEPASPRSLNPAIPRDLETIALKCLQKSGEHRYASADALTDDLSCYLAGRPIAARPVGRIERGIRLVRRNPMTSALFSLLALSLIAGAVTGLVLAIRANRYADNAAHNLYVAHMNLAQQYWDAGRAGPVLDILRRYIPKEGEPDLRGWEWYYQWNLCHRELRRFGEWPGGVQCVAVSPEGTRIAAGGDEGALQLFDTATGRLIARLSGHTGTIYAVAFSPDGRYVASGGEDNAIRIWDMTATTPLPTGVRPGEVQEIFEPRELKLEPLAFLSGHTNDIHGLAFSPDSSKLISSSEGGNARLWDTATFQPIRSILTGPARAIAFHPNGEHFASAARDGVVHLWNVTSGDQTASMRGHSQNVNGLAFNREGTRLYSSGSDGRVFCFDTATGSQIWTASAATRFNALSLSANEMSVAVGADDQAIRLYDGGTGVLQGTFRGHTGWVQSVAFLVDGSRLVSASMDGSVRLWNESCSDEGRLLPGHSEQVFCLAFSPDGRTLATADADASICVWDTLTGLLKRRLRDAPIALPAVAWSPDGKWLAAGCCDSDIYLWDAEGLTHAAVLQGHTGAVGSLSFSPNSRLLASASADDTVLLWNVRTGEVERVLNCEGGDVARVAFSPDGKCIATAQEDGSVCLWSMTDRLQSRRMQAHVRDARGLAFSSDGKWLVTSGGGSAVRIWDATTGKDLQAFHGHDGTAYSVAVSRDGKRIASGANDQLVKLWDVNSGQEIRTMRFGEQVRSVAFSPHGRQIAAAGNEGAVRIWDASDAGPASGQREALGMVIGMIETGLSKGEVDAQIKTDETISEAVRDTACRILKAYPLDEFAARNGERLARGGDWEKAAVQFTRACEAAPDDFHHWYSAALCELRFGRQDQYERTCRTMYERFKDDRRVVCNCRLLGICLLSPDAGVPLTKLEPLASRIQQAYVEFAKHGPARERSTYDLALFAYRRGNMAEAEVLLKEDLGAEINPSWYYLLAQVMIGQRQRSAAIEFFDQGRDLEASMAGGWIGPAVRHILCEQAHRAIEATANVR